MTFTPTYEKQGWARKHQTGTACQRLGKKMQDAY